MDEGRRRAKCPICGKEAVGRFRPFCSERCCLVDLGRWFGESYRIEAEDHLDRPEGESAESTGEGDGGGRLLH